MSRNQLVITLLAMGGVLLCAAPPTQAANEPFSLLAFLEQHVTNDSQFGPDQTEDQIGVHVRDIDVRRRVGLFSFDITNLKGDGVLFSNISLSNLGAMVGEIDVYGVIEELDNLPPRLELTWNNAPGVKNDPAPPVGDPVVLDHNDLTEVLLSFSSPARTIRASTVVSPALADFMNSDTDGIVTLLFAPAAEGSQGILIASRSEGGGTILEGFVGASPTKWRPIPVPPRARAMSTATDP